MADALDRLTIESRNELLELVKDSPGEWFRVSYDLICDTEGNLDFKDIQVVKRNKDSDNG